MRDLSHRLVARRVDELKPYRANARIHSKKQIKQIAESIERFGFTNPVLISEEGEVVAGHGRLEAAKLLGLVEIPTVELSHLSADERRAYVLADNKIALNAGWDQEILAIEFQALADVGFDLTLTGFSAAEIDISLDGFRDGSLTPREDSEDDIPEPLALAVTRPGDVWKLDHHLLRCGDARQLEDLQALVGGGSVDLVFTDPPYNVPINGHVCGLGKTQHREFTMASGEMTSAEFCAFLSLTLGNAAAVCRDGAIAFVCMDWRHMGDLLTAGREVFTELKNVCIWNKTNGGMGTFYRSKHELVFVFKKGSAPHVNNFGLGDTGRYRTNVWDYPGVSSGRHDDLEMHPTVKPVALVADALRDCSRRGNMILDPFGGSGTTLIAAHSCGRTARLLECDPLYCDVIVRRFQRLTGKSAVNARSGELFDDVALQVEERGEAA